MKRKILAWALLLLCVAGGALAGGGASWQAEDIGLSMEAPADYTLENLSNGQNYVAQLQSAALDGVTYRMEATQDADLSGAKLDDLDEGALRGLLQRAGGEANYDCFFDEVSAQPYLLAEREGGAMALAVTVHGGYACVFTVRCARGQLSQEAKDGLMAVLAGTSYR